MLTNLTMHYGWWLLALVLIGAELLGPGFFMLWIGMAAAAMGVILMFLPELSFLVQAILFVALALISCYVYWHFVRSAAGETSDQPRLNRRAEQHVGKRYVLDTAIINGRGKVKVGDSSWLAEGPDLPAGSEVEVIATDGSTLKVKAAA
jgi:membrane protein implicated in regulation of membrane protease activity